MLFNTLRSLSLATRLSVGFSSILLLVAVAATGAYSVRTLGQHVQTLVQFNNVKTEVANELMSSIDNLAIQTRSARSVALFANLETDLDGKQAAAEVTLQRKLTEESNAAMAGLERKTQMIAVTLVVFALALGGAIGWGITNSVTQPIGRAVVVVAERIAKGDLTSEVEVRIHDETGRLLEAIRAMQDRLRTLVGGIRQAADSIQMASS